MVGPAVVFSHRVWTRAPWRTSKDFVMSQGSVIKVRLTLKGRPIRSYTFAQKQVTVGRDPESDIFLDNAGVSRNHAKFELTPGGYMVEDLGSANGTFLNDEQVSKKQVSDDDIVRVGKFALWVTLGEDKRTRTGGPEKRPAIAPDQGTIVLSNDQIDRMLSSIKADEDTAMLEPVTAQRSAGGPMRGPVETGSKGAVVIASCASFLLGVAAGAGVMYLILTRNPTFLTGVF